MARRNDEAEVRVLGSVNTWKMSGLGEHEETRSIGA
ncbi:MAG: hypothetical protein ACJA2W_003150 [Planctomycetota bacterium]|jgi:hypothetical protein